VRPRATFKDGAHPTAGAAWGESAGNAPPDIAGLVALGRTLRRHHGTVAAAQDSRQTLVAMSTIADDTQARAAFARCDSLTVAALAHPLARAGVGPSGQGLTAATLQAAATAALAAWPAGRGGARQKGYQVVLAECIVRTWTAEHGPPRISGKFEPPSEIVTFAGRVFDLVERRPFDRWKLAQLLNGAISTS
jgi:hypothetical protein